MKFSKANLSLLLWIFYITLMDGSETDNAVPTTETIFSDWKSNLDVPQTTTIENNQIQEAIEKFKEDVEKTRNSGTFNGVAPIDIKTPACFKDFENFLNALLKINKDKRTIMSDIADTLFEEYIDKKEKFDTPKEMIDTYLKRLRTLQLIGERVYQIFLKTSETYSDCLRLLCTHKEEVNMLIFIYKDIPENAYEKIFNNEIKTPLKKSLATIQSRFFAKVSTESKTKDNKIKIKPDSTKKSTNAYHKAVVENLNFLDNTLVEPFEKEYSDNTICKQNIVSNLETYLEKTQDANSKKDLLGKFLKTCNSELNVYLFLQEEPQQNYDMNHLLNHSEYYRLFGLYENSLKDLITYLEKSDDQDLKLIKSHLERMQTEVVNKIVRINISKPVQTFEMNKNLIMEQIERLENERKYYRELLNRIH